jgi:hypothetical protein
MSTARRIRKLQAEERRVVRRLRLIERAIRNIRALARG